MKQSENLERGLSRGQRDFDAAYMYVRIFILRGGMGGGGGIGAGNDETRLESRPQNVKDFICLSAIIHIDKT